MFYFLWESREQRAVRNAAKLIPQQIIKVFKVVNIATGRPTLSYLNLIVCPLLTSRPERMEFIFASERSRMP